MHACMCACRQAGCLSTCGIAALSVAGICALSCGPRAAQKNPQKTGDGHFCTPLEFSSKSRRETRGRRGDHRQRGREAKSSHPPLVSKVLLPESSSSSSSSPPRRSDVTGQGKKMLKFFSARDDDNESLLGAITEGETRTDESRGGVVH